MKTYIEKSKSVKVSYILEKSCSLSSLGLRKIYSSDNSIPLSDLLSNVGKGNDMAEIDFIKFKGDYKYLKTASLTGNNFLLDTDSSSAFEYIPPKHNEAFTADNNGRIINKYDILYTSTGSNHNIGDCCIAGDNYKHNFSSHIFNLKIKDKDKKFYIFAFLNNKYGKEYCDLLVPKASIMRRGGKKFLDIKIPFPTKNNYQEPEKVEKLISLIVQNLIDKEEQIKRKNSIIDKLIQKELNDNQNTEEQSYKFPSIKEIKNIGRLDTGFYEKKFKLFDNLLLNYKNGYFNLIKKGYSISRGQNLQISNIGESYYKKENGGKNFYKLVLSSNISEGSLIVGNSYLGNLKSLKELKQGEIIFCGRGAQFGRGTIYLQNEKKVITNIDNMHIYNNKSTLDEKIFITQLLRFYRKKRYLYSKAIFGNGSYSFTKYHLEDLVFPDFSKDKQEEIAKEYYNIKDKNTDLNLENYSEKEKIRNKELGVFQLNIEISSLKEKLEYLISNIVVGKEIKISFDY